MLLEKESENLGDVIEGDIQATLAGWKGCHSRCCDIILWFLG